MTGRGSGADPYDAALRAALNGATRDGDWELVEALAGRLRVRQEQRARAAVVDLDQERARRER